MILLLLSWFGFVGSLFQQTEIYYVVHVKGVIMNQTRHDTVSIGDKLFSTDKLLFKSLKASATILSPTGGRFTLGQPVIRQSSVGTEFIGLIKDVLMGEPSTSRLSTRGLSIDKIVDLKGVFSADTFIFAGNRSKIILDPVAYPMSGNQFFMFRYTYHQDKLARRRIPFRGDTLIFDKKILYTVNGEYLKPEEVGEVEIYKVNTKLQSSTLIASFRPVFVSDEHLRQELQVISDVLKTKQKSPQAILDEMYTHVLSIYGETDKNMLKLWAVEHVKM